MTEYTTESTTEVAVDFNEKKLVRVLHVDDERSFLKVAKQCLETEGLFQVDTAESVEKATRKLTEEPYDAVVCDYKMPEKDGLEFLKELRQKGNGIPFIILTGRGNEEVVIKALNLGADQYLNKTGDPETLYSQLAQSIRQATHRRRAEEALQRSKMRAKNLLEFQNKVIDTAIAWIDLLDKEGNVTLWNRAAELISGYSREEVVGHRKIWEWLYPDPKYRAEVFAQARRTIEKEPKQDFETVIRCKDGASKTISWYSNSIRGEDGKSVGSIAIGLDVTEIKKAEQALQKSEQRYRDFADSLPEIAFEADDEGNLTFFNQRASDILGYSQKDLESMNIFQLVISEDRARAKENIQRILKGEKSKGNEYTMLRKDGSTFPVIAFTNRIVCEDGKDGVRGVIINISEQKNTEKKLRESEEKFRNLAEQSPNMIFINKKGRVVYANKKAEETMGYTREEFYSPDFDFLTLIAPESRELVKSDFTKHMRGEEAAPYEYKLLTRQGRIIDAILNSRLITYEGDMAILGTVTEITDLRKAEKAVQEGRKKFEGLFVGNPEAAAYLGPDFRILDINPCFEKLFGYGLAEIKGRHIDDVIVPKSMIEEGQMLNDKAIRGYVYHNTSRRRKNGSLVPVSVSAAPITVEGDLVGVVAMYKDISELKKTEEKLETMNEKLRVVGSLTRHDVRNKLSVILGNMYLVSKGLSADPKAMDRLKEMGIAVEQVVRVLDFAKAYEMLGAEELVYTDVERTFDEAFSLFPGLKDVKVVNDCKGLDVLADSLLRQLFYNLIDNSLKYGEKTSTVRAWYEKISEDELRLVYEDDGVGIPSANKPKLFKEGYSTGGSTGYGLYLIAKMVEVYGWTIRETGEPGRGAQFTMIIPRKREKGKENYKIR
jgi:PAS domain S-box-containing protein